jgi:hypothetical protein
MEFFGGYREAMHLAQSEREVDAWSDILGWEEYVTVVGLFLRKFFRQDSSRKFPLELEAAADLALWVPVTPTGFIAPTGCLTWYDIQPGWRFLRACQFFAERNKGWTFFSPFSEEFRSHDDCIDHLQNEVCDSLHWPRPDHLTRCWATAIDEIQGNTRLSPLVLDLDGCSGRLRLARSLLGQRVFHPYSLYLFENGIENQREVLFPGFACKNELVETESDVWRSTHGWSTNWFELLVVTGSRFFMEGYVDHPHFGKSLAFKSIALLELFLKSVGCQEMGKTTDSLRAYAESEELRKFWE